MYKTNIVKDSTELRKAIAENPDLPIVVLAGQDAASDEYGYTYCERVSCGVGEILDCLCEWEHDIMYDDRDLFEEALMEYMIDKMSDEEYKRLTESEIDIRVKEEAKKYEQYWHKAIIVWADN